MRRAPGFLVQVKCEMLGEPQQAWCDTCALPSASVAVFAMSIDEKLADLFTVGACPECGAKF